jgi:undecaprenyl-diphosphatase
MSLDLTAAEHANAWAAHHDGWEDVARAYAGASELLFLVGVVVLGLAGLLLRRRALVVASVLSVLAAGGGLVVASIAGRLIDRPRPFAAHPRAIHAFLAHAPDPGFPSDHATAAFAIAAVLLLVLGLRTLPVLVAAVALAVSRVLIGIHYPGDVIAGALLGGAAAIVVVLAARRWVPWAAAGTWGASPEATDAPRQRHGFTSGGAAQSSRS